MEYEKLIESLKSEYNFVFKPLPNGGWGYSEYICETHNLNFVCGSSNGDMYYILKKDDKIILHDNVSVFSGKNFKKEQNKMNRKIYKLVQKIVREERIKNLLND